MNATKILEKKATVMILAGGYSSRFAQGYPKTLFKVHSDKPMIYHILKYFYNQGQKDILVALGQRGELVTGWVENYFANRNNVILAPHEKGLLVSSNNKCGGSINFVQTGEHTMTGGRMYQVKDLLADTFTLTYADAIYDLNLQSMLKTHAMMGKMATLAAVVLPSRYGHVHIENGIVEEIVEKPDRNINMGVYVLNKEIFNIGNWDDKTVFIKEIMPIVQKMGELAAFVHEGFWQPIDTFAEGLKLRRMYMEKEVPDSLLQKTRLL